MKKPVLILSVVALCALGACKGSDSNGTTATDSSAKSVSANSDSTMTTGSESPTSHASGNTNPTTTSPGLNDGATGEKKK